MADPRPHAPKGGGAEKSVWPLYFCGLSAVKVRPNRKGIPMGSSQRTQKPTAPFVCPHQCPQVEGDRRGSELCSVTCFPHGVVPPAFDRGNPSAWKTLHPSGSPAPAPILPEALPKHTKEDRLSPSLRAAVSSSNIHPVSNIQHILVSVEEWKHSPGTRSVLTACLCQMLI